MATIVRMTDGVALTSGSARPLPPAREIVIGLALWVLIIQLFGGAGHHFSFRP
jgi:hypothetical protein